MEGKGSWVISEGLEAKVSNMPPRMELHLTAAIGQIQDDTCRDCVHEDNGRQLADLHLWGR